MMTIHTHFIQSTLLYYSLKRNFFRFLLDKLLNVKLIIQEVILFTTHCCHTRSRKYHSSMNRFLLDAILYSLIYCFVAISWVEQRFGGHNECKSYTTIIADTLQLLERNEKFASHCNHLQRFQQWIFNDLELKYKSNLEKRCIWPFVNHCVGG